MRLAIHAFIAALALLLGACSTLPPRGAVKPTATLSAAEVAVTTLARVARASVPADAGGPSGFRLLPAGEHAFDARAALSEAAEQSLFVKEEDL